MTFQSEAFHSLNPHGHSIVFHHGMSGILKRGFDIMAASLGLLFLSPLFIFVGFFVRRDGGPVLFRQTRVGRNGKNFQCLKFRTMIVDAEARLEALLASDDEAKYEWQTYQKLTRDPRITRIGQFLRKTSFDELPQLINVLKGEMSLVGPRPMLPCQTQAYGAPLAAYVKVRPGITGHWQVNGRNSTTFERRAELDQWYVENWSLWRDGLILLLTVREVAFAKGS